LRGHPVLGDISIDLSVGGKVIDTGILVGSSGSGKSLLLRSCAFGWGAAAISRGTLTGHSLRGCRVRLNYEIDGEVAVIEMSEDKVTGSPLFHQKRETDRNLVLFYGVDRVITHRHRDSEEPMGISSILSIVCDIFVKDSVRDSVILIDDFDLGLDEQSMKLFWAFLWKHHRNLGNQLIVGMRRGIGLSGREIRLPHEMDILGEAIKLAKKEGI